MLHLLICIQFLFVVCMCLRMYMPLPAVEVRGRLERIGYFLLPCVSWWNNLKKQTEETLFYVKGNLGFSSHHRQKKGEPLHVCPSGCLFFYSYKGIISTERNCHLQVVGHPSWLCDVSKADSSQFKNNYENKIYVELSSI